MTAALVVTRLAAGTNRTDLRSLAFVPGVEFTSKLMLMCMDFTVEFYTTVAGGIPVLEFLNGLRATDPGDFAAVMAGLAKLRHRQYHREPRGNAWLTGWKENSERDQF